MGIRAAGKNLVLGAILRGRFASRLARHERNLALTFDDGPNPLFTPRVLDLLRAHGARATFFVTGGGAERHPELLKRIVEECHEVANHSYSHVKYAALPVADQLHEIDRTNRVLENHDGQLRHWFRPPQGRLPPTLVLALLRTRQPVAMWSYDSNDYRLQGADAIVRRFERRPARSGDIILFHDDNEDTVIALDRLLVSWRRQGFRFPTLSGGLQRGPHPGSPCQGTP